MNSRRHLCSVLAASLFVAQGLHAQTPSPAPAAPAIQAAPAAADDPQLDADFQAIVAKLKTGDIASIVDKMYTPFITAVGGVDVVKAQAAQAQAQMTAAGLKIESFNVVKPITPVVTSVREYRIIPVDSIMDINSKRIEIKSFWLAIRDVGTKSWQYLDGQGLSKNPQVKEQFFPDLKDTTFPTVQHQILQ